jgi:hypothetical protein
MDVYLYTPSQEMQPIPSRLAYRRVRPEITLLPGRNMQVRKVSIDLNALNVTLL